MMSIGVTLNRLQSHLKLFNCTKLKNIYDGRQYSVFPPFYKKPVFRKEEQATLELSGEFEDFAHTRFRPVLLYESCSIFWDPVVSKFTNVIMREGKKILARSLVEGAFEEIKRTQLDKWYKAAPEEQDQIELDPTKILYKAIENVMPVMELKPMKKGGTTYMVPVPISPNRQRFVAMNWLIKTAKEKDPNIRYTVILAKELLDAAHNTGRVVRRKQDLHKQCEQNRAYAHFRWM